MARRYKEVRVREHTRRIPIDDEPDWEESSGCIGSLIWLVLFIGFFYLLGKLCCSL